MLLQPLGDFGFNSSGFIIESAMKFIGLDKFGNRDQGSVNTTEIYRDSEYLIDFYGNCTLQQISYKKNVLVMTQITLDYDKPRISAGQTFTLTFRNAQIESMNLDGHSLDDLGCLSELIYIEDSLSGYIEIHIASSIVFYVRCDSVQLEGLEAVATVLE